MYYTYILRSKKNGLHYVGQTMDVNARLLQHNSGRSRYTKDRGPWQLIYFEQFNTRSEAMIREKFLKTGKGRDYVKNLNL